MKPYEVYAEAADAAAYEKHKKWLPTLGIVWLVIGGVIGGASAGAAGLFLGAVLGFALAYGIYRFILYSSSQSTADDLYTADWCKENNCHNLGDGVAPPNGPFHNSGKRQKAWSAIEGDFNGLHTLFYNFSYWTESSDGDGSSTETEHPYKIMRLTGRDLPIDSLSFAKRGFMNKLKMFDKIEGAMTKERPVEFESVEFNKLYDLTIADTADDIWIRRIFDPATIQACVNGTLVLPDLKYYDKSWWIVEAKHFKAKELEALKPWQAQAAKAVEALSRVQTL